MRRVIVTRHPGARMVHRRISYHMVVQTLRAPDRPYRPGNVADEEVAERRFGHRTVQVVFEERKTGETIVITMKATRAR